MNDEELKKRISEHNIKVLGSTDFKAQLKYLSRITQDLILTIQCIATYSERAPHIYNNQLCNKGFDDLLQSLLSVHTMITNGAHNPAKRELRYCLEMTVKYLAIDQLCREDSLIDKISYLKKNVPRSSISIAESISMPFNKNDNAQLISEIKDLFAKLSSFIHPSKSQLENQLASYERGEYIGFESIKSITAMNKLLFRTYDIILILLLIDFGQSMSGDLFTDLLDHRKDWKFHKGKYVSKFSSLYNYKEERQKSSQ